MTKVGSLLNICLLNFSLQKHDKKNESEGDENLEEDNEEGHKKKKVKKTKVCVLLSFTSFFLTIASLQGLLISSWQTFHITITSKPSK